MAKILVAYSTTDGHTCEICQRICHVIEQKGHQAILASIDDDFELDLNTFDKLVIGASIRYGKHSKRIYQFVKNNQLILESKPNAFFSVNVVARKPEKNTANTNPYLIKFLRQISWKPQVLSVFAGKIDYPKYHFFDKIMIRFIMWMTKGPTDPNAVVEFTDWQKVEDFGAIVSEMK